MAGRYKIKTVAERSGFSPTLLRAWERRYSFLEPERQDSGHRFYTDDDLKVLRAVRMLLDQGQTVGEVSALGREALLRFELGPAKPVSEPADSDLSPELEEMKRDLIQCIRDLNVSQARAMVRKLFQRFNTDTLYRFTLETGREVGELWASGHLSVASEHLLSTLWKEQLLLCIQEYSENEEAEKGVICAGFPDELHELGLMFLQYELVKAGHRAVYLGAALPFEDLETAVTRLDPHTVCLSVSRTALLQVHLPRLAEAVGRHTKTAFVVGGSGIVGCEQDLIRIGVTPWRADQSLTEAAERLFQ